MSNNPWARLADAEKAEGVDPFRDLSPDGRGIGRLAAKLVEMCKTENPVHMIIAMSMVIPGIIGKCVDFDEVLVKLGVDKVKKEMDETAASMVRLKKAQTGVRGNG